MGASGSRSPTPRGGIGVAAVNAELFVFGGETLNPNKGGGEVHGEVEVFNPATNTWRSLSPMPTPRHGIWASVIDNNIFVPGGGLVSGIGPTNVNEVFIPLAVGRLAQCLELLLHGAQGIGALPGARKRTQRATAFSRSSNR